MQEMNILHVTPAYPPAEGYGGGPEVCKRICDELLKRGHSVSVYTTTANDRSSTLTEGKYNDDGIHLHRASLWSNTAAFHLKLFLAQGFNRKIKNTIAEFDVVHIHDYRTPLTVSTVQAAEQNDIPTVLQPHGTVPRKGRLRRSKWLFDTLVGNMTLGHIDRFIALNSTEAASIRQYGMAKDQIEIIPNGISLETVPEPTNGTFRESYDIPEDKKLVLYLGRLHRSKRVDLLIEAAAAVEDDNIAFVIVGSDDGDRSRLASLVSERGIEDRVSFAGRISESEKWCAYADADVFVTPSFYGFPLTFLEAMSQRTPIITTTAGERLDELPGHGLYVTEDTPASLAAELKAILTDNERLAAASDEAYEMVERRYTWERIVNDIDQLYREVT